MAAPGGAPVSTGVVAYHNPTRGGGGRPHPVLGARRAGRKRSGRIGTGGANGTRRCSGMFVDRVGAGVAKERRQVRHRRGRTTGRGRGGRAFGGHRGALRRKFVRGTTATGERFLA